MMNEKPKPKKKKKEKKKKSNDGGANKIFEISAFKSYR
jgi:hypothetical protein